MLVRRAILKTSPRLRATSSAANAFLSVTDDDAEKIAHLYEELGWTQMRVARLLGCSQTKVSKLFAELDIRR